METAKRVETHEFSVDRAIIAHLIQSQSDTLPKAIVELVMNAIDAGAERIDVHLEENGHFAVVDDGCGFRSKEEVTELFGRFGTPHEDGDATFGRFRIGRGQIMALAACRWRSGRYAMATDFRNKGIRYDLVETDEVQAGCVVEGSLYEKPYAVGLQADYIAEAVRYVEGVKIFVNGELANEETGEWSDENDWCRFRHNPRSRALSIYNQGILVRHDGADILGVTGVLVSRKPLRLNTSRDNVLKSGCETWRRIEEGIRQWRRENILAGLSENGLVNRELRKEFVRLFFEGAVPVRTFLSARFLETADGKVCSPAWVARHVRDVWWDDESPESDKFDDNALRRCADIPGHLVLARHMDTPAKRERAFFGDAESFFQDVCNALHERRIEIEGVLNAKADEHGGIPWGDPDMADYEAIERAVWPLYNLRFHEGYSGLEKLVRQRKTIVPDKALNFDERAYLKGLRSVNRIVFEASRRAGGASERIRRIVVGEAGPSIDAWTDGRGYIAFNRSLLRRAKKMKIAGVYELVLTLVHEYAHDSSENTDIHGEEFYRLFHDTHFAPADKPSSMMGWALQTMAFKVDEIYLQKQKRSPLSGFFIKAQRRHELIAADEEGKRVAKLLPGLKILAIEESEIRRIGYMRKAPKTTFALEAKYGKEGIALWCSSAAGHVWPDIRDETLPDPEDEKAARLWAEVLADEIEAVFRCRFRPEVLSEYAVRCGKEDPRRELMQTLSRALHGVAEERAAREEARRAALGGGR